MEVSCKSHLFCFMHWTSIAWRLATICNARLTKEFPKHVHFQAAFKIRALLTWNCKLQASLLMSYKSYLGNECIVSQHEIVISSASIGKSRCTKSTFDVSKPTVVIRSTTNGVMTLQPHFTCHKHTQASPIIWRCESVVHRQISIYQYPIWVFISIYH